MNYNGKRFRSVSNSPNGEVDGETYFDYHQSADVVWATYKGGGVHFGALIAICDAYGRLTMRYQHINRDGQFMTGKCVSVPEVLSDGRLRMHEKWQWTCGIRSCGASVIEEIQRAP